MFTKSTSFYSVAHNLSFKICPVV